MTSEKGSCSGSFVSDASGNPTSVNNLNFIVSVTTLKSEKGSTMDNNAYKAMAADKYPAIKFVSNMGTVKSNGGGSYTITAPGKLTISSGTKDVTLVATGKMNADKSIKVDGNYQLKTTDYNVKAISIMLGAIKTSPDVTIVYSMTMKPE
jgi:polyisoprenoid-binding protein YceI